MGNADDLRIRDANNDDRAAAQAITVAAYQEYAAVMPPFAWDEYRLNMLSVVGGEGPPATLLVAELGGSIVGSVVVYPAGTQFEGPDGVEITTELPEVRLLAVAPEARGRGVGKALMDECIRRARQSGVSALGLHTADMMQVAMQMYERMGFVRAPETDFHPVPEVTIKGYKLALTG